MIDPSQRLSRFEAVGIVFLRNKYRQKKRSLSSLARPLQIPLPIWLSLAHAAAMVKFAIQRMHMAIKYERAPMDIQRSR